MGYLKLKIVRLVCLVAVSSVFLYPSSVFARRIKVVQDESVLDSTEKGPLKIAWINFGIWRSYWFAAMGIETVAGYIERNYSQDSRPLDQVIFYYNSQEEDEFIEYLLKNPPDYIGFSVNPMFFDLAIKFAEKIYNLKTSRESLSETKFVFGNQGLMGRQEEILKRMPDALVVMNEGEEAMLDIISNRPLSQIPNLYYRNDSGKTVFTFHKMLPPKDYIAPKVDIPHYNNKPVYLYSVVGFAENSRGCSKIVPCSFCANSALSKDKSQRKWRLLNIEEVLRSIVDQVNLGKKVINFGSDDFLGLSPEAIVPFLERLKKLKEGGVIGEDVKFYASIRVNNVYSESDSDEENTRKIEILELMRQVGFTTLFIGFESGSEQQLRRYLKMTTPEENLKAIEILKKLGFHIDGGFITFDPLMSLDDGLEDMDFLEKCGGIGAPKLLLFSFNYMHILPGTTYERMLQKSGIDPKTGQLMDIVRRVVEKIPYFHFELFLQKLRTFYFLDIEHEKIKEYENIIIDYSKITIPFFKDILNALKEGRPTEEIIDRFFNEHDRFLEGFYKWAREEIPEMFQQQEDFSRPERDI